MLPTYKAILRGNHLSWIDEEPKGINQSKPIAVYVTIVEQQVLQESEPRERGQKMAEILDQLAGRNALSEITDPVAWQRELRREQPLADRD